VLKQIYLDNLIKNPDSLSAVGIQLLCNWHLY